MTTIELALFALTILALIWSGLMTVLWFNAREDLAAQPRLSDDAIDLAELDAARRRERIYRTFLREHGEDPDELVRLFGDMVVDFDLDKGLDQGLDQEQQEHLPEERRDDDRA